MVGLLRQRLLLAIAMLLTIGSAARATSPPDYLRDVKPILARRRFACHGALKQTSELRLDTRAMMLKGGEGGPALVPGKSADSPIMIAVTGDADERMPPEGEPLTPEQIATLRSWIDAGAPA